MGRRGADRAPSIAEIPKITQRIAVRIGGCAPVELHGESNDAGIRAPCPSYRRTGGEERSAQDVPPEERDVGKGPPLRRDLGQPRYVDARADRLQDSHLDLCSMLEIEGPDHRRVAG